MPSRSRTFAVLALAVPALALAGCGGSDDSTTVTSATTVTRATTDVTTAPVVVGGCVIQEGAECPGLNLADAGLAGANLAAANLAGTNLSGADLAGATLEGADLTGADLSGARLEDTNLDGADLTRANLTGATLEGVALEGAIRCETTRTDGTLDYTSCPQSAPATTAATPTAPATTSASTGGPRIVSFTAPDSVDCTAAGEPSVTLAWRTEGAEAIELAVDGMPPGASAGFEPDGEADLPFECDGRAHVYSITATDAGGVSVTEQRTVAPVE